MLWPVFVFWATALVLLRVPSVALVYALFAAMPFGALAVVPPPMLHGLALAPAPMVAVLLVARCLGTEDGRRWFVYACRSVEHFVPLLGFWAVAVVTTLVSPTLFGGSVEVVPLAADGPGPIATAPLGPSLQQASQLGHVTLSVFVVIAAARLLRRERTRAHALRAMMLGGSVATLTGLLARPAPGEPFAGLMRDPADFGTLCVMFVATLWFHRRSVRDRWLRTVFVPWLCLSLGIMAWLSAAPVAWTGLALVAGAGALEASWRALRPRVRASRDEPRDEPRGGVRDGTQARSRRRRVPSGARRVTLLSLTALALLAGSGPAYDRAADLLARLAPAGTALAHDAASGAERAALAAASVRTALDTWGLGVGVGGHRAPDAFLGLVSGVGVLGTLCCVAFVVATWAWRPSRRPHRGPHVDGRVPVERAVHRRGRARRRRRRGLRAVPGAAVRQLGGAAARLARGAAAAVGRGRRGAAPQGAARGADAPSRPGGRIPDAPVGRCDSRGAAAASDRGADDALRRDRGAGARSGRAGRRRGGDDRARPDGRGRRRVAGGRRDVGPGRAGARLRRDGRGPGMTVRRARVLRHHRMKTPTATGAALASIALVAGCGITPTLTPDSARGVGAGNARATFQAIPSLGVAATYGVTDRLDVQAVAELRGSVAVAGKYTLVDAPDVAVAVEGRGFAGLGEDVAKASGLSAGAVIELGGERLRLVAGARYDELIHETYPDDAGYLSSDLRPGPGQDYGTIVQTYAMLSLGNARGSRITLGATCDHYVALDDAPDQDGDVPDERGCYPVLGMSIPFGRLWGRGAPPADDPPTASVDGAEGAEGAEGG